MTKRIVDEAFARELEEKNSSALGERFPGFSDKLEASHPLAFGVQAKGLKGLIQKLIYKFVRPVFLPLFVQQHNLLKELSEVNQEFFQEIFNRLDRIEKNVRLVYIKTGESLADLSVNIPNDIESRVAQAKNAAIEAACKNIEGRIPAFIDEIKLEMKEVGKDLISRSDMLIHYLESQVAALEHDLARHTASTGKRLEVCLTHLDSLKIDLEEVKRQTIIISRETALSFADVADETPSEAGEEDDLYTQHQDAFRGPSELIRKRQDFYLEFFRSSAPVLDIGCGRGEFIQLLNQNGVEASGLDINEKMVEICAGKGLKAETGDLQSYFGKAKPESLGGIFCAQVVEHISFDEIKTFFRDAYSALKKDGLLVVETINPESVYALTRYFYLDPTHVSPIPPQLLKFYAQACGFRDVSIKMLSEAPESERLYPVDLESVAPSAIQNAFERLNRDIERVNNLLFGHYEYAIVARK